VNQTNLNGKLIKNWRGKQGANQKSGGDMAHPGPHLESPLTMSNIAPMTTTGVCNSNTQWAKINSLVQAEGQIGSMFIQNLKVFRILSLDTTRP